MSIYSIYLWIWLVCFILSAIWINRNTTFLKKDLDFLYFNFEFVKIVLYLVAFLFAPIILGYVVWIEIKSFYIMFKLKITLIRQFSKLKNKELKRALINKTIKS